MRKANTATLRIALVNRVFLRSKSNGTSNFDIVGKQLKQLNKRISEIGENSLSCFIFHYVIQFGLNVFRFNNDKNDKQKESFTSN